MTIIQKLVEIEAELKRTSASRMTRELWVCPNDYTGPQIGTKDQPIVMDSDDALEMALAWPHQLNLHAGEYTLTRASAWKPRPEGRRINGNGSVLKLKVSSFELPDASYPNGYTGIRPDVPMIYCDGASGDEEHVIEDLTLDARDAVRNDHELIVNCGIRATTTLKCKGVVVRGLKGRWTPHPKTGLNYEAFGISSVGPRGATKIRDCRVYMEPDCYGNGFTVGHLPNYGEVEQPMPSTIEDCYVDGGSRNHVGYTASSNVLIQNCYSRRTNHGVYQDTAGARNIVVRNCHFTTHWCGIRLHSHNEREAYEVYDVDNTTISFESGGINNDCILFAATHQLNPAKFSGIRIRARVIYMHPNGKYYRISSSLPASHLDFEIDDLSPMIGIDNLPAWSKTHGGECVAMLIPTGKNEQRS